MRLRQRSSVALVLALVLSGCAKNAPPTLTPAGIRIWQANEAVVAIGVLQDVAIRLNAIEVCEPAPCRPLLSDANTRTVVDAVTVALTTIRAVPSGWKATTAAALEQIESKLDDLGKPKLRAYLTAARAVLNAL